MQEGRDKDERELNRNRQEVREIRKAVRSRALSGEIHNKLFFYVLKNGK